MSGASSLQSIELVELPQSRGSTLKMHKAPTWGVRCLFDNQNAFSKCLAAFNWFSSVFCAAVLITSMNFNQPYCPFRKKGTPQHYAATITWGYRCWVLALGHTLHFVVNSPVPTCLLCSSNSQWQTASVRYGGDWLRPWINLKGAL